MTIELRKSEQAVATAPNTEASFEPTPILAPKRQRSEKIHTEFAELEVIEPPSAADVDTMELATDIATNQVSGISSAGSDIAVENRNLKRKTNHFSFQKNKISHLYSPKIQLSNRFSLLETVLLHDKNAPEAFPSYQSKRISTHKVKFITSNFSDNKREISNHLSNEGVASSRLNQPGFLQKNSWKPPTIIAK